MSFFEKYRGNGSIIVFLSLILVSAKTGFSQSTGQLELFHGGVIGANLRVGNSGLQAFSGTYEAIGGGIAQLTPGGESVRWNPVGLAYLDHSQIFSEWLPPFHLDLNPLLQVENRANTALRKAVQDYVAEGASLDLQDFAISPKIGLDGGQGSYAAIIKTRYFAIGGAIQNETRARADLSISGTKFRAATETGNGGTTIRLLGVVSGTLTTDFNMSGVSLAAGGRVWRGLGVGVGLDRMSATLTAAGILQPEAQISSGAQEYVFNSQNAQHYDTLQANTAGAFSGSGTRWRFGLGYHFGKQYAIDMAYFPADEIAFDGRLLYKYDQIRAIDLSAGKDEPFFDAGKLLEDDFTGTHPRRTTVDRLRLRLPGQLALAGSVLWRGSRATLTFIHYTKTAALAFHYATHTDSSANSVSGMREVGLEPHNALFVNLGAHWLLVRLGAVNVTWLDRHSRSAVENRSAIWLPILGFSGGFVLPYYQRLRFDYAFTLGVTSFIRFGTSYVFEM